LCLLIFATDEAEYVKFTCSITQLDRSKYKPIDNKYTKRGSGHSIHGDSIASRGMLRPCVSVNVRTSVCHKPELCQNKLHKQLLTIVWDSNFHMQKMLAAPNTDRVG